MAKTLKATDLNEFTGTEGYHQWGPLFRGIVATDGAKYVAETGEAYWLLDLIASHQPKIRRHHPDVDLQVWHLRKNQKGNGAVATCEDGDGHVVATQRIPFTDFPLSEITLWVEPGECGGRPVSVIELPSEH